MFLKYRRINTSHRRPADFDVAFLLIIHSQIVQYLLQKNICRNKFNKNFNKIKELILKNRNFYFNII